MPYADWYDRYAQVFDLEPGQMLNWPLNAPHRVENLNFANISMTVYYVNDMAGLAACRARSRGAMAPAASPD